jgi:hypothetical protein
MMSSTTQIIQSKSLPELIRHALPLTGVVKKRLEPINNTSSVLAVGCVCNEAPTTFEKQKLKRSSSHETVLLFLPI